MLNKLVDSKDPEQYLQRVFEICSFERNKKRSIVWFWVLSQYSRS